jgi:hypothetical protein
MQALRAAPAPPLGGGAMQAELQVAAQHVAQQQLNAAALATMLSHGQPGQQYAQGALAQLLAFGAGQPVWPPHALAGQQMQLQPPPAQPDTAQARGGDERSGEERGKTTTNYAARHQARGAPAVPFSSVTPKCTSAAPAALTWRAPRDAPMRRRLRSGDGTASTTGWLRCARSRPSPPAATLVSFWRSC